ncbi:Na/Pi symporter [Aquabacter cavernae]|uniref:Na/Pi symporter n=1 Tax=Aquabacter cavernae TaxID=2496029 RepID=UPI000F8F34E2|nr:Na/Pi symporter [Aquabacter cavernae]
MLASAELLAGLGLLFIGLKLLSGHLQQAMGRRVRILLKGATRSRIVGFVSGAITGAVVQSSNAVTLISANLVRGGALTTRDAIPVVAGANVGTSALVFVASVDLKVAVFYLIALVGLCYQFKLDRTPARREWLGVLLGLALLFLGLSLIKLAPQDVSPQTIAALLGDISLPVGFMIGLAVAVITQSASTATILCLASIGTGTIDLIDSFFIVLGANLGSGIATLVSAGGLKGTGRQLCFVHIFVKVTGCLAVYLVWLALPLAGIDPAAALLDFGQDQAPFAISLLFLALQLTGGLAVTLFCRESETLARRLSPPTREDHVSQPHFITDQAMEDPASALELVAQETNRLVRHLPELLPDLDQRAGDDGKVRAVHWRGARAICEATGQFLVELIDRHLTRADLDLALLLQEEQRLLHSLQDTLKDFGDLIDGYGEPPVLAFNLCESLRTMMLELAEAQTGTEADFDLVIALTADKSTALDRIRRTLATGDLGSGEEARNLLTAVSLFERSMWLAHRLAMTLRLRANEANREAPPHHLNRDKADADRS